MKSENRCIFTLWHSCSSFARATCILIKMAFPALPFFCLCKAVACSLQKLFAWQQRISGMEDWCFASVSLDVCFFGLVNNNIEYSSAPVLNEGVVYCFRFVYCYFIGVRGEGGGVFSFLQRHGGLVREGGHGQG